MHETKKKGVFEHNVRLKAQISMNVHKDKKKKKKIASQPHSPVRIFPSYSFLYLVMLSMMHLDHYYCHVADKANHLLKMKTTVIVKSD